MRRRSPVCSTAGRAWRTWCSDRDYVYHVLNRAVGRATLFDKSADYAAFEKVLRQGHERLGMRLLHYAVLPNHWHLVLWPQEDGLLSTYLQWLTVTHVRRWHGHHHTAGTGPIYQGRVVIGVASCISLPGASATAPAHEERSS